MSNASERETPTLIGSDKVEGTTVYGPDGERIGSIARVMIEKRTGRVSYAVLSCGGFLGIGDEQYPLPWPSLKYNPVLGGYQVMIAIHQLKAAPHGERNSGLDWGDATTMRGIDDL